VFDLGHRASMTGMGISLADALERISSATVARHASAALSVVVPDWAVYFLTAAGASLFTTTAPNPLF